MADSLAESRRDWGERLWFAPLNTLSGRLRWVVVLAAVALTVGWSAWLNGNLMVAWGLPDVVFYVDMAHGRVNLVPQPFSARPLAPLLARAIAAPFHWWVEGGFTVLAYVSLVWTAGVVFWLLTRTGAPRWMVLALAAAPFWQLMLGYAGLPDPLYAALLACLLLALEREWMMAAAGLMLPLMLARESTWLTLVCLLLVGWRRLRWAGSGVAVGCAMVGAMVVHRLSAGGLPNPEHMSGGLYLAGKLVANLLRSVGVLPWSNVYPDLCRVPGWKAALHVGPVRSVGVCTVAWTSPRQAVGAFFTVFGALPSLLLLGARGWRRVVGRRVGRGEVLLLFCIVYGGVSFAIAPVLGTWYARLFGYGWPLFLVAAPRLLAAAGRIRGRWAWVFSWLVLHVVICGLGDRVLSIAVFVWVLVLEAAAVALVLVQGRVLETAQTRV